MWYRYRSASRLASCKRRNLQYGKGKLNQIPYEITNSALLFFIAWLGSPYLFSHGAVQVLHCTVSTVHGTLARRGLFVTSVTGMIVMFTACRCAAARHQNEDREPEPEPGPKSEKFGTAGRCKPLSLPGPSDLMIDPPTTTTSTGQIPLLMAAVPADSPRPIPLQ